MSNVNHLLARCLGTDVGGGYQPIGFGQRLQAAYATASQAERVHLEQVLGEDWSPQDWSQASLAEEVARFSEVLMRKYPELESTVACALASRWSYDWR